MSAARFSTVRVSSEIHGLIQALESTAVALGQAQEPADVSKAFSQLSLVREALYQRIERIEEKDRSIERTIVLRF